MEGLLIRKGSRVGSHLLGDFGVFSEFTVIGVAFVCARKRSQLIGELYFSEYFRRVSLDYRKSGKVFRDNFRD